MKDVHKSDYRSLSYAISAKIIVLPSFHFSFFLQTSGGHHPKVQPIIFGVRDRDWVPLHRDPSFLLSCDCLSSFFFPLYKKILFFSFFLFSFVLSPLLWDKHFPGSASADLLADFQWFISPPTFHMSHLAARAIPEHSRRRLFWMKFATMRE